MKAIKTHIGLLSLLTVLLVSSLASGQPAVIKPAMPANVLTHQLDSKLMGREMPYRVILPVDYDKNKDMRYPVIYLLHGLTGRFSNWTEASKLIEHANGYPFIIVTPEGENGWYSDSVTNANDKFESYIIGELIPEVETRYRVRQGRESRVIGGLSMGGYGAVKFGLKYPDKFILAGSFSGALGAASLSERTAGPAIGRSLDQIFGGADSGSRKANDIFAIIRDVSPEKIKSLPFLYIDCGTEDFLFQNNREFISLLVEKKVPHEFRQLPGAHNWEYWNRQVQEFLRVAERRLIK
ncbi:MAG: esterase family protein [Blastocatellia bacterium]|nr:esterase family protein [Blastocatellia bacterium]